MLACRSIVRPFTQTVSAYFNNNLSRHNSRKWLKVAWRNFTRALTLVLINYAVLVSHSSGTKDNGEIMHQLQFFNLCYYGFVGYLMYLETYSV